MSRPQSETQLAAIALTTLAGVAFVLGAIYGVVTGLGISQAVPAAVIAVSLAMLVRHRYRAPTGTHPPPAPAPVERPPAPPSPPAPPPPAPATIGDMPMVSQARVSVTRIPIPFDE